MKRMKAPYAEEPASVLLWALGMLREDSPPASRMGALHLLGDMARRSPRYRPAVYDALTMFVRTSGSVPAEVDGQPYGDRQVLERSAALALRILSERAGPGRRSTCDVSTGRTSTSARLT